MGVLRLHVEKEQFGCFVEIGYNAGRWKRAAQAGNLSLE